MGTMRISEVARLAGCSVRALRHYHAVGAVPEPARDGNGYRRYALSDVAAVLRVRALVEAGIPLARIDEPGASACALQALDQRIRELTAQRSRLKALIDGPPGVPDNIAAEVRELFGELADGELAALELMAYTGVATAKTWRVIEGNLAEPTCRRATEEFARLWTRLGEKPADADIATEAVELARLLRDGYLRDTVDTLNPGEMPLHPGHLDLRGAQPAALAALQGEFA